MRFLWQFASFSGIMLFLSCVAPTIAFLSVNVEHFTNRQIRNAVMAVMAFGLIAWFVVALISEPINSLLPFYWFGLQVSDILSCLLCGIFLTVFGERTIFENIHKLYLRIIAVSAIFTVVILISIVLSHAAVVAILLIYLLFSLYDLKKKYKTVRYPLVSDTHTHTHMKAAGTSGATSPGLRAVPTCGCCFWKPFTLLRLQRRFTASTPLKRKVFCGGRASEYMRLFTRRRHGLSAVPARCSRGIPFSISFCRSIP